MVNHLSTSVAQLDFDGNRHHRKTRTLLECCLIQEQRFLEDAPGSTTYIKAVDFFANLNVTTRQRRERTIQLRVLKQAIKQAPAL